jgi:transcriptional regulator with XRE-family HTH domain
MTQEKLALESSLSQGYINQLESGRRRYTQKTLELIADALSIPLVELFKGGDNSVSSVGTLKVVELGCLVKFRLCRFVD